MNGTCHTGVVLYHLALHRLARLRTGDQHLARQFPIALAAFSL
jgi:hypothetical protein